MTTATPSTIGRAVARIREEPAAVVLFVQAAIGLGLAFGLELTAGQVGSILTFTAAALWLFLRAKVTPTAKVEDLLMLAENVDRARDAHPANGAV